MTGGGTSFRPWCASSRAWVAGAARSSVRVRWLRGLCAPQGFTQVVGEPPLQYLARWRMSRAAELLRETDDTIAQIAERVGYESVPSFSKAFKRWQGRSPTHHRAIQASR